MSPTNYRKRSKSRSRSRSRSRDKKDKYKRDSPDRERSHKPRWRKHSDEGVKLYLTNLGSSVTEKRVWEEFKQYGEVLEISIKRKNRESNYFGYVIMKSKSSAETAMNGVNKHLGWKATLYERRESRQMDNSQSISRSPKRREPSITEDKKPINHVEKLEDNFGKPIRVREIWVGNLPNSITEQSLYNQFFIFGEISKMDTHLQHDKNFAFIKYRTAAAASRAYEKGKNMNINGSIIRVSFSDSGKRRDIIGDEGGYELNEKTCKLLHISLNKNSPVANESVLKDLFKKYGNVKAMHIKNQPGFRPTIYLEYTKPEETQNALNQLVSQDPSGEKRAIIGDANCDINYYFKKKLIQNMLMNNLMNQNQSETSTNQSQQLNNINMMQNMQNKIQMGMGVMNPYMMQNPQMMQYYMMQRQMMMNMGMNNNALSNNTTPINQNQNLNQIPQNNNPNTNTPETGLKPNVTIPPMMRYPMNMMRPMMYPYNNNVPNMSNMPNMYSQPVSQPQPTSSNEVKDLIQDAISKLMSQNNTSNSNDDGDLSSLQGDTQSTYEKDFSLEEENLKNIWGGFLTKNKKDRVCVDAYQIRNECSELLNNEYNLNVSQRAQAEDIVKRPILGIIAFSPQNATQCDIFMEYIRYFNEKNRVGVINLKNEMLLYLVPPSDFSRKFYQNPKKHLLGIFVNFTTEPKAYVDMNNLSLPPPVISLTEKRQLLKQQKKQNTVNSKVETTTTVQSDPLNELTKLLGNLEQDKIELLLKTASDMNSSSLSYTGNQNMNELNTLLSNPQLKNLLAQLNQSSINK